MTLFWVALGTALGGMARYWCSGFVARRFGERFPWGTLSVNVIGSFIIGLFAALTGAGGALAHAPAAREFVIIGLCGGFTTFSSFSLQTLNLGRDREWGPAALNIVLSVAICLAAAGIGWSVGEAI